jgi:hypothetical protein
VIFTNVFQVKNFEAGVSATPVSLTGLPDDSQERYGAVQGIASSLSSKNLDATPASRSRGADVVLIESTDLQENMVAGLYGNMDPEFGSSRPATEFELQGAWENRVRTFLSSNGFQRVGRKYVVESDLLDGSTDFKQAFEVQADVIGGTPSVALDPCTRVMESLTEEMLRESEGGEEVTVRILPKWKEGELRGFSGKKAREVRFEHRGTEKQVPQYWEDRHDVGFVEDSDEMVDVYVPSFDRELSYPRSCVFGDFSRGRSLPDGLKKSPRQRVSEAVDAVQDHLESMTFARSKVSFTKAKSAEVLGQQVHNFRDESRFEVRLGDGVKRRVSGIHKGLKQAGPFAGAVDGEYVVVAPEDSRRLRNGFDELEDIYSSLNLGGLSRRTSVGSDGVIEVGSTHSSAFANRITEIRPELDGSDSLIVFVVLPDQHQSEVYFQARGKLFERLFGDQPVSAQAVQRGNALGLTGGNGYFTGVNIASQAYVKLGNVGSAVWVLDEPADAHVSGVTPGSTCYAYHDVSRRPERNAASTAYSATTDSYGRYIATGAKPNGGERLTDDVFHDIVVELLRKVSAFHRRQESRGEREFHFERLVFAKDGRVTRGERKMMKQVIRQGVPESGKRPVGEILESDGLLPDDMLIDVASVNKSANRRLIQRGDSGFENVDGGTAVTYGDRQGLLVSHKPDRGTAQPLEITLQDHVSLNQDDVGSPTAGELLKEYYNLSYLNWSSVFNQGKYALPQILTQNLGENLSAGIEVPDNMPMI